MKERRMARCMGEDNLAEALEALDAEGFEIEHIIFTGIVPQQAVSDLIGPQGGMTRMVSRFLVIGVKPAIKVVN